MERRRPITSGRLAAAFGILVIGLVPLAAQSVAFRGRVLDEAGAPLAGAGVVAGSEREITTADCLRQPQARAGDDGAFRLELERAPELLLVAADGRLGLCLEAASLRARDGAFDCGDLWLPRGDVRHGRVVDAAGAPIAGARAIASDALGDGQAFSGDADRKGRYAAFATSDARGLFALPGVAGGMRLEVSARDHTTRSIGHFGASAPTTIELAQSPPASEPPEVVPEPKRTRIVRVRARDAASGEPIRAFRAGVVWTMGGTAWLRLQQMLRDGGEPANAEGVAALHFPVPPMPAQLSPSIGVRAPGHALANIASDDDVVVDLEREARLAGVVTDAASGRPLAGVQVWALPRLTLFDPDGAVLTGEDGRFELTGLASGEHNVLARHPERPSVHARVELTAGHATPGLKLAMKSGCRLDIELTGRPMPAGARIRLVPAPPVIGPNFIGLVDMHLNHAGAPGASVATFTGLPANDYTVLLHLPARPRCGPPLEVFLDKIELRDEGARRQIDIASAAAARVRGRVTVQSGGLAADRLLVFSRGGGVAGAIIFSGGLHGIPGWRAFVSPSGEFELLVPPGTHRLWVVDLETGLPVHVEEEAELPSGETKVDLQVDPAIVTVRPVAEPGVDLAGCSLHVRLPGAIQSSYRLSAPEQGLPRMLEMPAESAHWQLFVLPGPVFLEALARSSATGIPPPRPAKQRRIEVEAGERCEVEVPVVPR
jgi:hypothetical protein